MQARTDLAAMGSNGSASSGSSTGSSGSGRRKLDYIAKVRYQNKLPPPPFTPKLVDYDIDVSNLLTAGSLSSVFLQGGIKPETDVDLGMPLDLSLVDGAFDPEQAEKIMCPPAVADAELSPEDLELLAEPVASDRKSHNATGSFAALASSGPQAMSSGSERPTSSDIGMGTSFLRRTAYMSGDTRRTSKRKGLGGTGTHVDVDSETRRIEQSFDDAQVPLESLKHPSKRGVHAVSAVPLFPDLKDFDLTYTEVRLVGSASLKYSSEPPSQTQINSAVFRTQRVEEDDLETEWMSMFVPSNDEEGDALKQQLIDSRDTLPAEEARAEEERVWPLKKVQDNDYSLLRPKNKFDEILLSTDASGSAFYYMPISGRASLKRRRVDAKTQERLRDHETDVLDLSVRELEPQESIQRDEVRSIYDPVNYG